MPFLTIKRRESTRQAVMRRLGVEPLPTKRQAVKAAQRVLRDARA
jgi:Arc/MetJ family transcription regulator